jgi:hypothetical protein
MSYTDNTELLLPHSQGCLLKNLNSYTDELPRKAADGRYYSFQFCAALNGNDSLYFDCRDSDFYNKRFTWEIENEKLLFKNIFPLPLNNCKQFKLPYRCGVKEFSGGWFEAAQIYRPWATRQSWFINAVNTENPLKDISMWVWNRGNAEYVVAPVEKLAADTGLPVALDWYWWHHNPYDTAYPDFWPPRQGEKSFSETLARLNSADIYTQVYLNGRTWDLDGESAGQGGTEGVEIKRDGTDHAIAFNTYNHHRLGYMCGTADKFQQRLEAEVDQLFKAGLKGVYLDMIGCTTNSACYNRKHSHVPGGGNYNVKAYRAMLQRMRDRHPSRLFSTEECSEMYLDLCESMIVLQSTSCERMGIEYDYVPAFSAIYHGANVLFGSYALPDFKPPWDELWPDEDRWPAKYERDWNAEFPCQFELELARGIVWGMQPMVCNLLPEHSVDKKFAEVYQFILKTAGFYYENRKLLYYGKMLSPGLLECGEQEVQFMSRMIFTRHKDMKVISKKQPALLHSVWENADGGRSLILANYTPEKQSFVFDGVCSGTLEKHSYKHVKID